MRKLMALLCVALLFLPLMALADTGNLLTNAGFEEGALGLPQSWGEQMWIGSPGISYLEQCEGGYSGERSALIENVSSNDARLFQTVSVTPGMVYKLSGYVKAEGCDPVKGGANLSITGCFANFPAVYDTAGEWVELSCYIRPGPDMKSIDVAARVGYYGKDTVGKAWFDDLSLAQVDEVPEGANVLFLESFLNSSSGGGVSQDAETARDIPSRLGAIAPWALVFAVLLVALWVLLKKRVHLPPAFHYAERLRADRLPSLVGCTPRIPNPGWKSWMLLVLLTGAYAVVAFVGLGDTVAPQTEWRSTGTNETVTFDLGETREFRFLYYAGIANRDFFLEFSDDGETWTEGQEAQLTEGSCFTWQYARPMEWSEDDGRNVAVGEPLVFTARYCRLVPSGPAVSLMEVAFQRTDGAALPIKYVGSEGAREENGYDPALLLDEQAFVPNVPSYMNGMYFDEIYHGRSAYEMLHKLYVYEWTHPPLGKIFIMLGIRIFGMTPFGWRFAGTLTGVLMIPAMYLLGLVLFKKPRWAFFAAFLMAVDLMHLTQTRIATIDSYAVLFILLMYLCMFRYLQMSFFRDGWRTLIPLGLSGVFMGLGWASKWICFYAAAGLAVLFTWSVVQRFLEWHAIMRLDSTLDQEVRARVRRFPAYLLGTLAYCVVFFILVPSAVYYLSYIPHFAWEGGLTFQRFWSMQQSMYSYHANLKASHPYASPWYEWPLILKPMWYYSGPYVELGKASTIMAMGNPAVWWGGFITFLYTLFAWVKAHVRRAQTIDHRPAMLLIGFAAQFIPWMFITRAIFIYHYFGSLPFVMLTIVYAVERLHSKHPGFVNKLQPAYMVLAVLVFAAFYPVATGVEVSRTWLSLINWLGWIRLPGWAFRGWIYF